MSAASLMIRLNPNTPTEPIWMRHQSLLMKAQDASDSMVWKRMERTFNLRSTEALLGGLTRWMERA